MVVYSCYKLCRTYLNIKYNYKPLHASHPVYKWIKKNACVVSRIKLQLCYSLLLIIRYRSRIKMSCDSQALYSFPILFPYPWWICFIIKTTLNIILYHLRDRFYHIISGVFWNTTQLCMIHTKSVYSSSISRSESWQNLSLVHTQVNGRSVCFRLITWAPSAPSASFAGWQHPERDWYKQPCERGLRESWPISVRAS